MRAASSFFIASSLALSLAGCEAVADFDRSKIPGPRLPTPVDARVDDMDAGGDDDAGSIRDAAAPSDAALDASRDAAPAPDASDDDAGDDDAG